MGAGASTSKAVKKARKTEAEATKLFDELDANKDGQLTLIEIFDAVSKLDEHAKKIKAHWTVEKIRDTIHKHDADADGKISRAEFVNVLADLKDSGVSKPAPKGPSKAERAAAEAAAAEEAAAAAEAAAKAEEDRKAALIAEALGDAPSATATAAGNTEEAFWAKQESDDCWTVPLGRDLVRMPWLAEGETGLAVAIARARSQGRTPLLVDNSSSGAVDAHFRMSTVLEAKAMFQDVKTEARTHEVVMNDARLQLIDAMRLGQTFYVRLSDKVTDFANGNFSGETTLPLGLFDQQVVNELAAYTPPFTGSVQSLHESDHPFAAVLKPTDLDMASNSFVVKPGFDVLVCSTIARKDYKESLYLSLPLPKMQAIEVRDTHI